MIWLTRASEFGSAMANMGWQSFAFLAFSRMARSRPALGPIAKCHEFGHTAIDRKCKADSWQSHYALAELYQVGHGESDPIQLNLISGRTARFTEGRHGPVERWKTLSSRRPEAIRGRLTKDGWAKTCLTTKPIGWLSSGLAEQPHRQTETQSGSSLQWNTTALEPQRIWKGRTALSEAAELGQVDAMYQLGIAYIDGIGVEKDYPSAMRWLARRLHMETLMEGILLRSKAQNAIGSIYENGYGVTSDLALAYAWYSLASWQRRKREQKFASGAAEIDT